MHSNPKEITIIAKSNTIVLVEHQHATTVPTPNAIAKIPRYTLLLPNTKHRLQLFITHNTQVALIL